MDFLDRHAWTSSIQQVVENSEMAAASWPRMWFLGFALLAVGCTSDFLCCVWCPLSSAVCILIGVSENIGSLVQWLSQLISGTDVSTLLSL